MSDHKVKIVWALEPGVPITGVSGVDYEMVEVRDLAKWGKRRQRQLRSDIAKGCRDVALKRRETAKDES